MKHAHSRTRTWVCRPVARPARDSGARARLRAVGASAWDTLAPSNVPHSRSGGGTIDAADGPMAMQA